MTLSETGHKRTSEIVLRRVIGEVIHIVFNDCIAVITLKEWNRMSFESKPIKIERK